MADRAACTGCARLELIIRLVDEEGISGIAVQQRYFTLRTPAKAGPRVEPSRWSSQHNLHQRKKKSKGTLIFFFFLNTLMQRYTFSKMHSSAFTVSYK